MIEYVSLLLSCGYKGTLSRKWLIRSLWFLRATSPWWWTGGRKHQAAGAAAGSSLLEQQPGNGAVMGMAGAFGDLQVHPQRLTSSNKSTPPSPPQAGLSPRGSGPLVLETEGQVSFRAPAYVSQISGAMTREDILREGGFAFGLPFQTFAFSVLNLSLWVRGEARNHGREGIAEQTWSLSEAQRVGQGEWGETRSSFSRPQLLMAPSV